MTAIAFFGLAIALLVVFLLGTFCRFVSSLIVSIYDNVRALFYFVFLGGIPYILILMINDFIKGGAKNFWDTVLVILVFLFFFGTLVSAIFSVGMAIISVLFRFLDKIIELITTAIVFVVDGVGNKLEQAQIFLLEKIDEQVSKV